MRLGWIVFSDQVDVSTQKEIIPETISVVSRVLGADFIASHCTDGTSPEDVYILNSDKKAFFLNKKILFGRLIELAAELQKECDFILLGCSGGFEKIKSDIPVIYPGQLLWGLCARCI